MIKPSPEIRRPFVFFPAIAGAIGSAAGVLMLSKAIDMQRACRAPDGFWVMTRDEWIAATCLTRHEQETARKALCDLGVLEEKRAGLPARLHYRLNIERLRELFGTEAWEAIWRS